LADARAENEHTIVDLGDNRYGVVLDDDTVAVCGLGQCTMPRPASEFPKLAEQIQMARSLNNGDSINKENPNGFTMASNKQTPGTPPPGSGRSSQGAPPPPSEDNPSDEARGSGNDAGDFFKSGGGASGTGASAGGTSGNGYAATAADGKEEVIKTQAAELDGVFTYIKTREIKASLDETASEVTTGGDGTFATPSNTPDANAGDLQFKGTQSEANR
ncbi:MAG: hypothetical protein NUW21_13985, partial [Elusimicrobia bacterium]|nr:hypothetical protein [Elusimicrobiota bacterium]